MKLWRFFSLHGKWPGVPKNRNLCLKRDRERLSSEERKVLGRKMHINSELDLREMLSSFLVLGEVGGCADCSFERGN